MLRVSKPVNSNPVAVILVSNFATSIFYLVQCGLIHAYDFSNEEKHCIPNSLHVFILKTHCKAK